MIETIESSVLKLTVQTEQQLVLNKIRLLCQRRIAWLRKVWTEMIQQRDEEFTPTIEVDGYLEQIDDLILEKEWIQTEPVMQGIAMEIEAIDQALESLSESRFALLAALFGLSEEEMNLIQTCFALAIDPDLGKVFAYMQDHSGRSYVTENLVQKLFTHRPQTCFQAQSPLRIWNLIREIPTHGGGPDRMECDPQIKNWLLGYNEPGDSLSLLARIQPVKKGLPNWPVIKLSEYLKKILFEDAGLRIRILVSGGEGSGRKTFAALVCQQLGLRLISIDASKISDDGWEQSYVQIQRFAFLTHSAIAWYGLEPIEKFQTGRIPSFHVQFFIGEPGDQLQSDPDFLDIRTEIPALTYKEREACWKQWVPQSNYWQPQDLKELIERYQSSIGQIVSLGQKRCASIEEAYQVLKNDTTNRLGKLASLSNGNFMLDDLIVGEVIKDTIDDFIFEASDRVHFWEQPNAKRLFPQGRSLIALFTGSPGTGKTMAAQVIATTLKLDLFRIDLSAVVSKYIGESSKNLERILFKAKNMDVVLLFDEADSLFGKRTDTKDAHDRYANTDTNYLLQAIEQYPGIIILTSNRKSGIDPAFMRRFRYVLDFPKPDQPQRLQLWCTFIEQLAGEQAKQTLFQDLVKLSGLLEMSGAQIKQTVLSALFMMRKEKEILQSRHLLKAIEREFMKEGKSVSRELQQQFKNYSMR